MTTPRTAVSSTLAISIFGAALVYAQAKPAPSAGPTPDKYAVSTEWPTYGHDAGGMRFSPLKEITPANVNTLDVAWTYHLKPDGFVAPTAPAGRGGGRGGGTGLRGSEATPLIINGLMYIGSPYGRIVALDATTGKETWAYTMPSGSPAERGVEYFSGDATTPPQIVVATSDSKLFTLDAKTGALNTKF